MDLGDLVRQQHDYDLKNKIRALIDSEYDSLIHFTDADLWDYLSGMFPGITREISDEIYEEIF